MPAITSSSSLSLAHAAAVAAAFEISARGVRSLLVPPPPSSARLPALFAFAAAAAAAVVKTLTPGVVLSGDENSSGRSRGGSTSSGESKKAESSIADAAAEKREYCCLRVVAGVVMASFPLFALGRASCGPFLWGVAWMRNVRSSMRCSRGSAYSCRCCCWYCLLPGRNLPAEAGPACRFVVIPVTVDVTSSSAKGEDSGVIDVSGIRCCCLEFDSTRCGLPGVVGGSAGSDVGFPFPCISRLRTSYGDGYSAKRVADFEGEDEEALREVVGLLLLV